MKGGGKQFGIVPCISVDTRWRSWFRHCATSRKVPDWIPDRIFESFRWPDPSGRIMALGSTQPLTEMSTTDLPWGVKADGE
jgi:hypothetical protein